MTCPKCSGAGSVQDDNGDHAITCDTCDGLGTVD